MNAKRLIPWLTFALLAAWLPGQATPWPHPDGTTHWYEVIRVANPIAWTAAESDAVRRGGHLATLACTGSPPDPARVFAELLQQPGTLRCRWLLPEDPTLVAQSTAEGTLRGVDASVAWAALVDTNELQEAMAVLAALEGALRPAQVAQRAAYRLVYAGRRESGIS